MMISSQEMRELEESSGVSRTMLMENAGKRIYEALKEQFDLKNKKILVVCSHGNNGGDGFVAARYLSEESETDLLFIGDESKLKEEALLNYNRADSDDRIQFVNEDDVDFDSYDVIIDAIIGTGIIGNLKPETATIISRINESKAFKLSVDVPSGMNPDTGDISGVSVNSNLIITFHDIKPGMESVKDKTLIADIGIPENEVDH